jgi:hypothetical protein
LGRFEYPILKSSKEELKMAKEKKSYPTMPASNWWALRKKFRTTLPREVTTTYLASALGMVEASAKNNVLPSLRITGLIDENGKPTDRAVNMER